MYSKCVCVCVCVLAFQTRLYQQVRLLGGQALGDLTVKTTHLICGEVQSLKYKVRVWVTYLLTQQALGLGPLVAFT